MSTKAEKRAVLYAQIKRAVEVLREATPGHRHVCIHQMFDDEHRVAYELWGVGARSVIIYATEESFDIYGSLEPNSGLIDKLRGAVARHVAGGAA